MRIFLPEAAWGAANVVCAAIPPIAIVLTNSRRLFMSVWGSKNEFQRKLDDARTAGVADGSEVRGVDRRGRSAEIGVIEYVEKLASELRAQVFDHVEGFEQRIIQIPLAGRAQLRAPPAAERADSVGSEDGSV